MMLSFDEILLAEQSVDAGALAHACEMARQSGLSVPAALIRLGLADERLVAQAHARSRGWAFLDLGDCPEPAMAASELNPTFMRRYKVVPIDQAGRLAFAMADPSEELLAALEFAFPGADEAEKVMTTHSQIDALLRAEPDIDGWGNTAWGEEDLAKMLESDSDAPIIRLVQSLLANAAIQGASDVHLEPMERRLLVRYRVDGRLVEVASHPAGLAEPVASRIKVMAGLDIAETRLPQDGRLKLNVAGRNVDVRVSTSPTSFGESVVLRLLGRTDLPLDLALLGLPDIALSKMRRALEKPHGIVLLTGPTGSGKTTTLYAAIHHLLRPDVKILTVEDPVEVLIEGVNQVQVRPEIGLSYAQALRSFLRQDPDILMIGEIRDKETAEIALRAALTGHLVLSTLHTNSTTGAFTRLSDIGIEPYLAASTVNAVIAQRLVRRLCPHCREPRAPTNTEQTLFRRSEVEPPSCLFEPKGCSVCQETGYRGRAPLVEVLEIDPPLRDAIRDGNIDHHPNPTRPCETLSAHGLTLVAAGITSMSEIHRATQADAL